LLQSSKYQYTALLCGLGIVKMFVPALATKSAEPPSQPQQRKIDSFVTKTISTTAEPEPGVMEYDMDPSLECQAAAQFVLESQQQAEQQAAQAAQAEKVNHSTAEKSFRAMFRMPHRG
jgi:hypothetical protein